eukprot:1697148-Pyramimonas_sp.AAC.1
MQARDMRVSQQPTNPRTHKSLADAEKFSSWDPHGTGFYPFREKTPLYNSTVLVSFSTVD